MNTPKKAPGKKLMFKLQVHFEDGEPMKEYDMEVVSNALVRDMDELVSTQHGDELMFDMDTVSKVVSDCSSPLYSRRSFGENGVSDGDILRVTGTYCKPAKCAEDSKEDLASELDCNNDEEQHPCALCGK
ncbi:hypothetical protein GGF41_004824 [Coemansia sp. RSA 2531]|nr:hypothetical protein GGF41_004824 [Coemansia sp. RSA 2531]